jgi:hypothetical protein
MREQIQVDIISINETIVSLTGKNLRNYRMLTYLHL